MTSRKVHFSTDTEILQDGSTPKRVKHTLSHRRDSNVSSIDLITPSSGASSPLRSSPVRHLGPNYDTDLTGAMDDVSISPVPLRRPPQPLQSPIAEATTTPTPTPNPQTRPSPRPAPPLVPLADIPQRNLGWIKDAIHQLTGISTPHDYQLVGINHGITEDDTILYIVRRTADGKSLVPQTIAFFRCGVAVFFWCH